MAASLSMPAVVAGVLALASGPMAALAADPVAEFYKGKQVSMIIGNPPGGGYDAYSRLLTRSMGKHIPGNPSMVPKNMPGAGGSKA
ncbi:MAG: hypothetical protein RLZ98_3577, partial [Pseudomonadota bacterium]